jgi:hypothetical protein
MRNEKKEKRKKKKEKRKKKKEKRKKKKEHPLSERGGGGEGCKK